MLQAILNNKSPKCIKMWKMALNRPENGIYLQMKAETRWQSKVWFDLS
jgi:hypothetical protein